METLDADALRAAMPTPPISGGAGGPDPATPCEGAVRMAEPLGVGVALT